MKLSDHFSPGALFVMAITFVLFGLALVTKGFTHDLLLEAAVFLVSVKLMLMAHRNSIQTRALDAKLDLIYEAVRSSEKPPGEVGSRAPGEG